LTKKAKEFLFDGKCTEAFKELKRRLTSAPILTIFDPGFEPLLEADASDGAIAACLKQKGTDGKMRVIAYYSRKMTGPELNYESAKIACSRVFVSVGHFGVCRDLGCQCWP
jgi:hypothetical protein